MPDPLWPSSPPEVNYLRLVGPGATGTATTLASASAWTALIAGNEVVAAGSTVNAVATAMNFEGVAGTGSVDAAAGLNAALHLLGAWAADKPAIAAAAVCAYETAVSTMIPAEVSVANRTAQASNVAVNPLVLGALTPAIAALDIEYFGEHWPHNAAAGSTYAAALASLSAALAAPPPLAPAGASPGATATAAATAAEAAGTATVKQAGTQMPRAAAPAADAAGAPGGAADQVGQLVSMMVQPLTGMFQAPVQASQGLLSLPQSLMGQLGGLPSAAKPLDGQAPTTLRAVVGEGALTGAGVGSGAFGGAGAGGTAALTSFTRPASSFAPENGGRPTGLQAGALSGPGLRGPATAGGGFALPISSTMTPTQAGMLGRDKGEQARDDVERARIVLTVDRGISQ